MLGQFRRPRGASYPPIRRTDDAGRFRPDRSNAYVGVQIRTGRRLLGISRETMADQLGADVQMFASYEHGVRDVPAMTMARIAEILNKPLPWFYHRAATPFEACAMAPAAPAAVPAPLPKVVSCSSTVLLVDDAADVLVTLGAFLEGAGLHVIKASNGDAALRIIASDQMLDAIVTDNKMPGLSGADLLLQAAQLRPSLPGLIITGSADSSSLSELPQTVAILAKPFRREELIRSIRELIRVREPVSVAQL